MIRFGALYLVHDMGASDKESIMPAKFRYYCIIEAGKRKWML